MHGRRSRPRPPATAAELADAFGEFMHTFEAFREANDEKLAALERRARRRRA